MRAYDRPVLIIHGDKDTIAPISYSEDALDIFPQAELKVIKGGDHMFLRPEDNDQAVEYILEYLNNRTDD